MSLINKILSKKKSKKRFFSLSLKRFCEKPRKTAKLKPLEMIQKNLQKMLGDDKTHSLWPPLDLILLSKIEWTNFNCN